MQRNCVVLRSDGKAGRGGVLLREGKVKCCEAAAMQSIVEQRHGIEWCRKGEDK